MAFSIVFVSPQWKTNIYYLCWQSKVSRTSNAIATMSTTPNDVIRMQNANTNLLNSTHSILIINFRQTYRRKMRIPQKPIILFVMHGHWTLVVDVGKLLSPSLSHVDLRRKRCDHLSMPKKRRQTNVTIGCENVKSGRKWNENFLCIF